MSLFVAAVVVTNASYPLASTFIGIKVLAFVNLAVEQLLEEDLAGFRHLLPPCGRRLELRSAGTG